MSALLIIGGGGHARSVADAALAAGAWDSLAFLDDVVTGEILGFPVAGALSEAGTRRNICSEAFVALGDNSLRLRWLETVRGFGFQAPSIIHPRAAVSSFAEIGAGCVVMAGAVVGAGAVIGEGCILNTGSTVDHDCVLEAGVHISPGAHIGGETFIGARAWVCIGAAVGSQRRVGADSVIAAGAAVVDDLMEPALYAGVPAIKKAEIKK